MDRSEAFGQLKALLGPKLDEARFDSLLSEGRVVPAEYDGTSYYRAAKNWRGMERGTVIAPGGLVPDYPHLPRVFHLARGVARNLKGPFFVEEKVDGYNARIAWVAGRALAFTRGGWVCPFTTDRLADFEAIPRFLARHEDLALCCEVVGPGSPYNLEHARPQASDIDCLAFDLADRATGRFLPPEERYALLDAAGVRGVRRFGRFDATEVEALRSILRGLEAEKGEGIVMKPARAARDRPVKYATAASLLDDLRMTLRVLGHLPPVYFLNRIALLASVWREEGHPFDERAAARLGAAILAPLEASMASVEAGKDVDETFEVWMREEAAADRFIDHIRHTSANIQVMLVKKEQAGGRWRLTFTRRYQRASGYFRSRAEGALFID